MAKYPNDDLFEGTKMSFGEHLEELRVCLFKSVFFLVIGFAVGLMIAKYVMQFMQAPLTTALENYYIEKTVEDLGAEYEGHVTPAIAEIVRTNRLVFDYSYVEIDEFRRVARLLAEAGEAAPPAPPADSPNATPAAPASVPAPAEAESSAETATKSPTASVPASGTTSGTAAQETSQTGETDKSAAAAAADAAARKLEIVGQVIPAPSSNLIRTRIWKPVKMKVTSLSAQEAFMIWMKAGLITGIVVASPLVFWQIWLFVAAGLYPHEKNYVYIYLPFSLILFLAGAGMAFGFVFKPVLDFLFSFNKSLNIDPDPRISEWLGFVLILPLGFGVSFQLPLVMLFLNRIGVIALETYVKNWRVAILAIFVISAVLTPADPISIFLMAGPLTVLFFLGLAMCRWMPRQKSPFTEAYEP